MDKKSDGNGCLGEEKETKRKTESEMGEEGLLGMGKYEEQ